MNILFSDLASPTSSLFTHQKRSRRSDDDDDDDNSHGGTQPRQKLDDSARKRQRGEMAPYSLPRLEDL